MLTYGVTCPSCHNAVLVDIPEYGICASEQVADARDKQQRLINAANKLIQDVAFRIQTKEIKMGCLHGLEHDVITWAAKHPEAKAGL